MWSLFFLLLTKAAIGSATCLQPKLDSVTYQEVLNSETTYVVLYAENADAPFDKLAEDLETKLGPLGICFAYINCGDKKHTKYCSAIAAQKLPSLQLYMDSPQLNPYTKKNFRTPTPLQGDISTEKGVEKMIGSALTTKVSVVKTLDEYNAKLSSQQRSIVLFSSKSLIAFSTKCIAHKFRKSFNLIQVVNSEEFQQLHQGVVPSYGVFAPPSETISFYDGDVKDYPSLLAWLDTFVSPNASEEASKTNQETSNQQSDDSAKDGLISTEELTHILDDNEPHLDSVWIVLFRNADSSQVEGWSDVYLKANGHVRAAQYICDDNLSGSIIGKYCQGDSEHWKVSLPYVALVPYSIGSRKKVLSSPSKYQVQTIMGEQSSIMKRAYELLPETAVADLNEADIENLIANTDKLRKIAVIVISDKTTAPSMLRNIAMSFDSIAKVVYMSNPSARYLQSIGNPKLPTAITMSPVSAEDSSQFSVAVYDSNIFGAISYSSLSRFVIMAYQGSVYKNTEPVKEEQLVPDAMIGKIIDIASSEDWEKYCQDSFRGMCGVVFTSSYETSSALEVITKTMDVVSEKSKSLVRFLSIKADCFYSFSKQFDVLAENTPTFVLYVPTKNRYASYVGSFNQKNIAEFIESVLVGKTKTFPLKSSKPMLGSSTCSDDKEAQIIEEDDDASDIIAEMLREENERARLAKEEAAEQAKLAAAAKEALSSKSSKKQVKKKSTKKSAPKSDL